MNFRYPETRMKPVLQEREDENLYCVTFHSGAQITIQLAIGFQLDTFTWYDIFTIFFLLFIVVSTLLSSPRLNLMVT